MKNVDITSTTNSLDVFETKLDVGNSTLALNGSILTSYDAGPEHH